MEEWSIFEFEKSDWSNSNVENFLREFILLGIEKESRKDLSLYSLFIDVWHAMHNIIMGPKLLGMSDAAALLTWYTIG